MFFVVTLGWISIYLASFLVQVISVNCCHFGYVSVVLIHRNVGVNIVNTFRYLFVVGSCCLRLEILDMIL